jgi:pimeloyl-ACP methyl ester carboxylesterase
MAYVMAAGMPVHVQSWGAGDPALLIHGASSDMSVFRPTVIPRLKSRFHLTAYDRPGMGWTTDRPRSAGSLSVQAKVAADVIDARCGGRCLVIAHSWAGAIALRLALEHPEKVRAMVLIAPVAFNWPGWLSWHLYWSAAPMVGAVFNHVATRPFAVAAARAGVSKIFAPKSPPDDYFRAAGVASATRPRAMRANALDLMAGKRELARQQAHYGSIKVPVGILAAPEDPVVNPELHGFRLAAALPNARVVSADGAGHVPHETTPELFLELVEWADAASQARQPEGRSTDWRRAG